MNIPISIMIVLGHICFYFVTGLQAMRELLNPLQVDMESDVGRAAVIILIVGQKRIQTQNYQTNYIVVLVVD